MVTDLEKHATTLHIDDADYDAEFTEPQATGTDSSVPTKPSESELNGLPDEFIIFKDVINGIECPTQNDKIFKEECIVTCDSCFSEMGLYICLKTFKSFGFKSLSDYTSKTGNKTFLNIQKSRLTKSPEEEPEAKRLAIGGEDGFKPDILPWKETQTERIYVHPDQYFPVDSIPIEYVKRVAKTILDSTSAEFKAEVAAWKPDPPKKSIHADSLVQLDNGVKVLSDPSKWKCCKCDLTENLWLNLSDGSLLCGRKNWDGSGGNGHALEHFNETKYPLCVKLGTITSEGGDVFSYAEDDMVTDPHLAKHLSHWGIDVANSKKTEMSMAEMELEMNKKVGSEYAAIIESGQELEPLFGAFHTGIKNLGNTCYIGSILQSLFSLPYFREKFQQPAEYDANCHENFWKQFQRVGHALCSGDYAQPIIAKDSSGNSVPQGAEQEGISPGLFKSIVSKGHADFQTNQQQDAVEFLLHLLDVIKKEAKKGNREDASSSFAFEIEERVQFGNSVQYKNNNELMLGLPVDESDIQNLAEFKEYEQKLAQAREAKQADPEVVRGVVPFESSFSHLLSAEAIDHFKSPVDGTLLTAHRAARISKFPKYLLLQCRRFTIGANWQPKKLNVSLEMPEELDLEAMRAKGPQPGEDVFNTDAPKVDEQKINQLVDMGYPFNAAMKALYHTNESLELAMEWLMSNLDSPDFNEPLKLDKNAKKEEKTFSPEIIAMVTSMGFTDKQSKKALSATDGNVERAIDWIFSHLDELNADDSTVSPAVPESDSGTNQLAGSDSSKYRLRAFVSHMGSSTACGHYVAHVKEDLRWILFNDNKVAVSQKPPRDLGYLYVYEQI
ncbi:unnamed protein product [Oikopleura dioica]|uniref:Ubiquitin carboxyl-terminal hydrolase n=1 Tax=Oikopleura dioica TaxID=34765 RepID=E4X569_OIKDI|nr:unnamed protein product [Oikopleura dioica]